MPANVLILSPDSLRLASMAGALSEDYPVLAARNPKEALRLLDRNGPCRVAYCEVGDDVEGDLAWTNGCRNHDMKVIALVTPPCPEAIIQAAVDGRIQGVCQLPLTPKELRDKTREALDSATARPASHANAKRDLLTREEVEYLLRGALPLSTKYASRPR